MEMPAVPRKKGDASYETAASQRQLDHQTSSGSLRNPNDAKQLEPEDVAKQHNTLSINQPS